MGFQDEKINTISLTNLAIKGAKEWAYFNQLQRDKNAVRHLPAFHDFMRFPCKANRYEIPNRNNAKTATGK